MKKINPINKIIQLLKHKTIILWRKNKNYFNNLKINLTNTIWYIQLIIINLATIQVKLNKLILK